MRYKRRKDFKMLIFVITILSVSIGYALIATNLNINGTGQVAKTTWDIHLEKLEIDPNSVTAKIPASITADSKEISYSVKLTQPGEYYKFSVDVVNAGSIDAMIETFSKTPILTEAQKKYISYTITYFNKEEPKEKDLLKAGNRATLTVLLKFKDDVDISTLPSDLNSEINYAFSLNYVVADKTAKEIRSPIGVDLLLSKANDASVNTYTNKKGEMYVFSHSSAKPLNTPHVDYRYIGSEPNNYLDFNDYTWRIIGVFPVDDGTGKIENRIKAMYEKSLSSKKYGDGTLNNYDGGTTDTYLNSNESGNFYYTMNEEAKNSITSSVFYLGGGTTNSLTAEDYYKFERGDARVDETRSLSITRNIGLMYPSDYLYTFAYGVNDDCYNKINNCTGTKAASSWLYYSSASWFISPRSNATDQAYAAAGGYISHSYSTTTYSLSIRPVVYLKADVRLRGDGTASNHYQIAE